MRRVLDHSFCHIVSPLRNRRCIGPSLIRDVLQEIKEKITVHSVKVGSPYTRMILLLSQGQPWSQPAIGPRR